MKICPVCQRCYEDADLQCSIDETTLIGSRHGSRFITEKYRLDRLLGRGGMGAVYAGTHIDLDREIAIKLLLPDFTAEADALERFRREARAAAKLNHQNVADTYDYGTLPDGGAYIVMELVNGQSLRDYMNAAGALPFAEAVSITRQAADGVEAAHRNGIIHRDLKPGNIILARDHQQRLLVKVVDFGVAKLREQTTTSGGALTASGSLIGTPRYMAPEQCSGHPADARSDIYSLGVILYEMLAARPPFDAPTATAVALKHIQASPPPLQDFRADVPPNLDQLVRQALDKNPERRPQTATEFADRLELIERELSASTQSAAGHSTDTPTRFATDPQTSTVAASQTQTHLPTVRETTQRAGEPTSENLEHAAAPYIPAPVTQEAAKGDSFEKRSAEAVPPLVVVPADADKPDERTLLSRVPATANMSRGGETVAGIRAPNTSSISLSEHTTRRSSYLSYAGLFVALAIGVGALTVWLARARTSSDEAAQTIKQSANNNPASPTGDNGQAEPDAGNRSTYNGAQSTTTNNVARNVSPPASQTAVRDQSDELRSALSDWIAATNARDVNRQMSFYAPVLEKYYLRPNASASFVRADKSNLFTHTNSVDVRITEPSITFEGDGRTATMRYNKSWNFTGGRADRGQALEELRWSKTKNGWKIISERDLR